jgi:hypothetical protein
MIDEYFAQTRYHGPALPDNDADDWTATPIAQPGRIHPVDPAAHARLREFWVSQPPRPRQREERNVLVNLLRAQRARERKRAKVTQ